MKPKNFPERKNERRKKALEDLKAYAKRNNSNKSDTILKRAIKDIEAKIVDNARGIRTKIYRGKAGG